MKRRVIVIGAAVLLLAGAWYLFRPERLFVNAKINEAFPTGNGSGTILSAGNFHSVAHTSAGMATIFQLPAGNRVLRFTNFQTSNGPDVHVYLVAASDASDNETVTKAGFIDLGSIKGNIGDQNYDLPSSADLSKYRAVTVWCKRFSVNFATAPLTMDAASAGSGAVAIASGSFHDVAHKGVGTAAIYQLADDKRVLRFTNFETSNGPDVRVYLGSAPDAMDSDTVTRAGFVEIAPLKGNIGDQNYDLPSNLDLSRYNSVTIWCKRFGVNFATAPLSKSTTKGV